MPAKSGFVWSWHMSPTVTSNSATFLSYTAEVSNWPFKVEACLKGKITVVQFLWDSWYSSAFIITILFHRLRNLSCATTTDHSRDSKFFHYNTPDVIRKRLLFSTHPQHENYTRIWLQQLTKSARPLIRCVSNWPQVLVFTKRKRFANWQSRSTGSIWFQNVAWNKK